ncbi:MAG: sugar-binding protein, partial [Acidobacteriota bacterium]|nr:sugar-binding protein [Acidobacteriota bacterium]
MSEHIDMSDNDLLPLRSPEEAAPAFELVRRGYDRDQVDNHLGWLEDQLRNAEVARDAAEQAAASAAREAEVAREELERGRPQWHEFGDRITEILNLAEDQGAQIRAQRSQEADELLAEARQLSADTERTCAIQVRDTEANTAQMVADAEAKS